MMNYKIIPSILSADHGKLIEEAQTIQSIMGIDYLHVDIMDGHFVPNLTFGPEVVSSLKKHTDFSLDVHLMIENVDYFIPQFADAGADILTIHQEASRHLDRSLELIRQLGAKAGATINPATPVETLRWVLPQVDLVLIMSVNPGFGGQEFIVTSVEKIKQLRNLKEKYEYSYIIEVDGGITAETAPLVYEAGAEYLVAGQAIFGEKNRDDAIQKIIEAIEGYRTKKLTIET